MVDDESHNPATAAEGGAQSGRDGRSNSAVIAAEAAPIEAEAAPAEAAETEADSSPPESAAEPERAVEPPSQIHSPAPLEPKPASSGRAFAAGAVGGAVVAAAVTAAGLLWFPPAAKLPDADLSRIAALEAAAGGAKEAIAKLDKQIGAIDARSASAAPTAGGKADASALQAVTGDLKSLRGDVDAARGEIPGLAQRVAKLETGASAADIAGLTGKVAKIETALAAPKVEKPTADSNPSAAAVVAEAIRDKLDSGASIATELNALEALGVDPAKLAPLKALAGGAPTDRALAAQFEAIEPKVLAAAAPKDTGAGVADKFLAHLRGLVQIRRLGETAGEDPAALVSQVRADLRRGDLDAALAAFAKLPAPARDAASAWSGAAQAKEAAVEATQSIREAAVARLAQNAKP